MTGEAFRAKYCGRRTAPTTGVQHLALTSSNMEATLDFWCTKIGFPLVKVIDQRPHGYHFFLDIGGGQTLAFFLLRDSPPAAPGVSAPVSLTNLTTGHGAMNHVAFAVPSYEVLTEYRKTLRSKGVKVTPVVHHSAGGGVTKDFEAEGPRATEFASIYAHDPDGVMLEICFMNCDLSDTRKHVQLDLTTAKL
eukprot:Sspe_Gene.113515::Locus_97921_Transcript_3_5_Confidence_0.286_Length_686::g.113515::m.113515